MKLSDLEKELKNPSQSKIREPMSLKVDSRGNVYVAPLRKGERSLSFKRVGALASSRR